MAGKFENGHRVFPVAGEGRELLEADQPDVVGLVGKAPGNQIC